MMHTMMHTMKPCIPPISAVLPTSYIGPLSKPWGVQRLHKTFFLLYLIYKSFLCNGYPQIGIHVGYVSSLSLPILGPGSSLPYRSLCPQSSNLVLFCKQSANPLATAFVSIMQIYISDHLSFPHELNNQAQCLRFFLLEQSPSFLSFSKKILLIYLRERE